MEKLCGKVYLGYEDEVMSEKNKNLSNYAVNKIGGLPDWPPLENVQFQSKCPLCGLHRILVVQCYAPLESSVYHRTLYIFACLSPNCWNQSESWLCLRSQIQDNATSQSAVTVRLPSAGSNMSWCNGADEWDENDNDDSANGNIMNVDIDNASPKNGVQRSSDEDDESNSLELETVEQALGNLQVYDVHNANMSPLQGAVGAVGTPVAAADLEGGDEPGLVIVDTPTAPTTDLQALLHQTAELPAELRNRLVRGPLQFVPKYIYVEEEWRKQANNDVRVAELLNKYRKENAEMDVSGLGAGVGVGADGGGGAGAGGEDEPYEASAPPHGDALFHAFLTRLRDNPGQILRYSRSAPPLLGAPLPLAPRPHPHCARCGARLVCELQLMPELSAALALSRTDASLSHLHFLSVLVFTCSQSCWQPQDTIVQETVVFQSEVV